MATITLLLFTPPFQQAPFIYSFHAAQLPSPPSSCQLDSSGAITWDAFHQNNHAKGWKGRAKVRKLKGQGFPNTRGQMRHILNSSRKASTARLKAPGGFILVIFFLLSPAGEHDSSSLVLVPRGCP